MMGFKTFIEVRTDWDPIFIYGYIQSYYAEEANLRYAVLLGDINALPSVKIKTIYDFRGNLVLSHFS